MKHKNSKKEQSKNVSGTEVCIFKKIQYGHKHNSANQNKCLSRSNRLIKKDRGEVIFAEGEDFENVFCIHKGLVKITKSHQGEQITLWIAKEGDLIGLQSFLNKEKYTYTAIAVSDSEFCVIPAQEFSSILHENKSLYLSLMQLISKRVSIMEKKLGKSSFSTT